MKFEKIKEPILIFCDEYTCREPPRYKITLTTSEEIKKYHDPPAFKNSFLFTIETDYHYLFTRLCLKHFQVFLKDVYEGPYDELTWDLII